MSKKITFIIIAVILLVALSAGSYFYWIKYRQSKVVNPLDDANNSAEDITNNATKGVIPEIQTNPLEDKPDVNPADKANPFRDIKTNPF